jgi:SAM-dependent methyltransferase
MECEEPEFWEIRYRAEKMPWDLKGTPAALLDYLERSGTPGRVLIPGCGLAYEVQAFAKAGWDVSAVDFSPAAVESARRMLGPLAGNVCCADVFADDLGGPYDFIYERTFLCSLPPTRWPEYSALAGELLRPGGVLAGVFYYGHDPDPPPYPLTPASAQKLFGETFERIEDLPIPLEESLPVYNGLERWQVWHTRKV